MTYVDNIFPVVRRVGNYVARILNGELPAAMPIEYPTKFELVMNLKNSEEARHHDLAVGPEPRYEGDRVNRRRSPWGGQLISTGTLGRPPILRHADRDK